MYYMQLIGKALGSLSGWRRAELVTAISLLVGKKVLRTTFSSLEIN
jgi:hypothetical protein